jgi:hypothetical protein
VTKRTITNKKVAHARREKVPNFSETELLAMTSEVRKVLLFDDLANIIQHSEKSKRIAIKFVGEQRMFHIEFLSIAERDDFLAYLRIHLQRPQVNFFVLSLSTCDI